MPAPGRVQSRLVQPRALELNLSAPQVWVLLEQPVQVRHNIADAPVTAPGCMRDEGIG